MLVISCLGILQKSGYEFWSRTYVIPSDVYHVVCRLNLSSLRHSGSCKISPRINTNLFLRFFLTGLQHSTGQVSAYSPKIHSGNFPRAWFTDSKAVVLLSQPGSFLNWCSGSSSCHCLV